MYLSIICPTIPLLGSVGKEVGIRIMQNSYVPPIGYIGIARDGHGRAFALPSLNFPYHQNLLPV